MVQEDMTNKQLVVLEGTDGNEAHQGLRASWGSPITTFILCGRFLALRLPNGINTSDT
jgi:hypothetical protein